jgi:predicted ferric reductase
MPVIGDQCFPGHYHALGRVITMTTAEPQRTRLPPSVRARWVFAGVVAAHLVVVETIFIAGGAGNNTLLTIGNFFGLHVATIIVVQLTLIARLPWLDRRIGMDRLTVWHRWLGLTLFWVVLLHASFVVLGFARLDRVSPLRTFVSLAGQPSTLFGISAATILIVVVALSTRYARRRLQYETWHALHLGLYATVTLALIHQSLEPHAFSVSPLATAYWWTIWALVLTALVVGRIVLPFWRNTHHQFRVARVVPESDNVVSVYVTGKHLERLPTHAGQFFIWHFPDFRHWWRSNPFSLSAAPDGQMLRLTAKNVGPGTAALGDLPVGSRVFAEGPYGAFTSMHRTKPAMLLIAGGIGVTPIRSLLEEAGGAVTVLYRVRTEADAVLLPEIQALASARGVQVHVLTGRTAGGSRPFEPESLAALVPDITERDIYVCGPQAMTAVVLRSLRQLKIPSRQVHAERFSLVT